MYDLNTLCDLSLTDFKVLTVAKSISDSCLIIGDGVTNSGENMLSYSRPRRSMAAIGRMFVASGFGSRTVAAGGGRQTAGVTSGMAVPVTTLLARRNRLIAGGGRCLARRIATARRRPLHLTIATVASTDASS
jgi:hypothetical protein